MTEDALRGLAQRYALRRGHDATAPREVAFYAYYAEVPGCLAQGSTAQGALAELDALFVPFMQLVLADGGAAPVPFAERMRTNLIRIGPILVGNPAEFGKQEASLAFETQLDRRPDIQRKTLLPTAAASAEEPQPAP